MSRERRPGFREALWAYVTGHDRVAKTGFELTHPGAPEADAESDVIWDGEWHDPADEPPRYGVGIPDRLEFHRGPATWREDDVGAARPSGENDAP